MTGDTRFYVYFHISNITSEVFYVGKGNDRRAYRSNHRTNIWRHVANKHGYTVSIPHTGLTENQAFRLEEEYITKFGRRDLGTGSLVNLTNGGEGASGNLHSEEWKRNMSKRMTGRVFTEEHRRKNIAAKLGRKRSESMKLNLSKARKGIQFTEEHKEKLRLTSTGRKHTEESRKKMSEVQKISKIKQSKPVLQLSKEGVVIARFSSIKEAERATGADNSVIVRCCKNIPSYNTAGGFKWKYE